MSQRFYVSTITGTTATLDGAEAHHLLHVMRAKPGDGVTLFDGGGGEWPATITGVGRSSVELELGERRDVDRELPTPLVMGVALPKGDRQKALVEKLTELGVARLVPLVTERSVVSPKPSALDKLRRGVIEASKQCGRNRLMVIDEPAPLAAFLGSAPADAGRLIAHPTGPPIAPPRGGSGCWVAVGPEGGFAENEVADAGELGWAAASLGASVLRIETAAAAFAAVLGAAANAS